jgi:hypothetical protein
MTATEVITVLISVVSIVVAVYAAVKTKALSEQQLRLGNRNEFQKMLFEITRQMLAEPILYSIYDDHPLASARHDDLAENAKRESVVWLFFHMFELVFAFYPGEPDSPIERESLRCWNVYCASFFRRSSLARAMISRPEILNEYNVNFRKVAEQVLKETPAPRNIAPQGTAAPNAAP